MRSALRRHPVVAFAATLFLLAVAGVALAPWWIDLGPVRAKIERAASSALAGKLTYERMELSWFPRPEVVVRGLRVSVPGHAGGTVRTVRVSPSLLPLLRGRVVITKIGVDGLDLDVTLSARKGSEKSTMQPEADWTKTLRSLGSQTLGVDLIRSRVELSRPEGRRFAFEGIRLEAALRADGGRIAVTLSRLSVEAPKLILSGDLRADAGAPRVEATVRGENLDVTDVRAKLLSFAGDDAVVTEILGILRGGTLTSFSFASSGKSPAELGRLERMSIRAAVKDGAVRVPGPDLDLGDVSADVALEGGALTAEGASARIGSSRAEGGKVLVGLARGDDRLRVEARVRADLAALPAILANVIPGRTFREEVALVEGLRGSAAGRITVGDLKSAPKTSVDVSEMRFSTRYARLPWPIEVKAGRFLFDGERVGVGAMAGSVGRSTFSGLAARVRLGKRLVLESSTGSLVVSLEDFLEGARSIRGAESLVRSIGRLSGSLFVDVQRLAGPLARLDEASLAASGNFEEILFDSSSSLPPLSIASGRFAVSDDAIRVTDAGVQTLDASLRVSGAWRGWRGGEESFEAAAEGELGPRAIDWGWGKASLPAVLRPVAPIGATGVRFSLAAGGALSLTGAFTIANGPRVALDLTRVGGTTDVRDLKVTDGGTDVSVSFRREEGAFDGRFRGTLDLTTFGRIFEGRPPRRGRVEGDVRLVVPAANPGGSTADGALTAADVDVPTPAGPVTVERLEARASGRRLDVAPSSLLFDGQRLTVSGSATSSDGAIVLDADAATSGLSWARVEEILGRIEDAGRAAPRGTTAGPGAFEESPENARAPLAMRGDLRVSLDSFSYQNLVFRPVLADLKLGADSLEARLRKAEVCSVSTTGEARLLPGGSLSLEARADAAGPDINVPLTCLGLENVRMTGAYELSAHVEGQGPGSGLGRALRGALTFRASKGRIGKASLLTKILGVLNATDVFAGKDRTRVGEAIPYERISVDAELAEGRVSIREAAMKAPSITMAATGTVGISDRALDLMVLSHPLSTVDKVVQSVPVVRRVLGHDFLAVAVKVTGTVGDPKVAITPGRDVGKGLIGILERTVTLPVTIFEPPAPGVGSRGTPKEDE